MGCRGISNVSGLRVVATGWLHIDGLHTTRNQVAKRVRSRGGTFQVEFNSETDLVLLGDYLPHQIQSDRVGGVDALEELALSRERGWRHVHLVNQDDLGRLLNGEKVPCRHVPRAWYAMKKAARPSVRRGHP